MNQFLLSLFLFLLAGLASAQTGAYLETNNAKKSLQHAQQLINDGNLKAAKKQLKQTVKIKDNFAVAYRELGKVSLELNQYEDATIAFERSFELDENLSRAAFFECAEAHFRLGNVDQSDYYYKKYKEMKGERYANKSKESGLELTYDLLLAERQANCEYISTLDTTDVFDWPKNVGQGINSEFDDYLPTITSDGDQLVFTRTEKNEDQNIYISKLEDDNWQKARVFSNTITTDKNEGMAKFELHGRAFYFSGCSRPDTEGGCDIYKADILAGQVVKTSRLPGKINSHHWDSQPSISCNGRTMYFSSVRKEGFGGADLYVSYLLDSGEWSVPKNLGPHINSPGDEEAPFISSDGKTLYFSSTGLPGQGDGDLFMTYKSKNKWSVPINLGYPINSPSKELGIYIQGNGTTAYFASAREGTHGGLDVFEVELPEEYRPQLMIHVEGNVFDAETKEPISTKVIIGNDKNKWVANSDEDGWFFICLPGNKGYSFQAEEAGYDYYVDAHYLESQDNTEAIKVDVPLSPEEKAQAKLVKRGIKIKEKRVQFFFNFDSFELTRETSIELKALVKLLKEETEWKVEIVGYADNVGSAAYNQRLSENRAKAIVDYLKNDGITISKVVKNEGRGAVKSVATNKKDDKNRRVDVVLRRE